MRNGVKKWVVEVTGKEFQCAKCQKTIEVPKYGRNLMVWFVNQHVAYRNGIERVGGMLEENFNISVPNYKLFQLKTDLVQEYC
jgi:hypothetical protein